MLYGGDSTSIAWLGRDKRLKKLATHKGTPNDQHPRLPAGIVNPANDCFLNSVLQAMIATPILQDMITFHSPPRASADPSLSPALTNGRPVAGPSCVEWSSGMGLSDTFLQFMQNAYFARDNSHTAPLSSREIKIQLSAKFDQYRDIGQQDAHELLRHLLDGMYMDEWDIIKKRKPPPNKDEKHRHGKHESASPAVFYNPNAAAGPSNLSSIRPQLVPFASTVFGGKLASVIVCNECKHISHTVEDFLDLSIPIKTGNDRKKSRFRTMVQKIGQRANPPPAQAIGPQSNSPGPKPLDAILHVTDGYDEDDNSENSSSGRQFPRHFHRSRERSSPHRAPSSRASSIERDPRRPPKPTPGEVAYLKALFRDDTGHASNPLRLLRSTAQTPINNPPSSYAWAQIEATGGLLGCLREFTSVEILDEDNAFACHNCWKLLHPQLSKPKSRTQASSLESSSSSSSDEGEIHPAPVAYNIDPPELNPPRSSSADLTITRLNNPFTVSNVSTPTLQSTGPSLAQSQHPYPTPYVPFTSAISTLPRTSSLGSNAIAPRPISRSRTSLEPRTSAKNRKDPVFLPELQIPQLPTDSGKTASHAPFSAGGHPVPSISTTSPTGAIRPLPPTPVIPFRRYSAFTTPRVHVSSDSFVSAPGRTGYRSESEGGSWDESSHDKERESEHEFALASDTDDASMTNSQVTPTTAKVPNRSEQVIHRRAFKRYLIDEPPPVLVIHLKRFQHIGRSPISMFAGTAKKMDDYVPFPEVLDLRPFLAPRKEKYGLDKHGRTPRRRMESGPTKSDNHPPHPHHHHRLFGGAEEEDPPVRYQLYAVVVHIGNMLGGHYIVYTALPRTTTTESEPHKTIDGPISTMDRQWCCISDTVVRLASIDEVLKSKAYLLFYEKMD